MGVGGITLLLLAISPYKANKEMPEHGTFHCSSLSLSSLPLGKVRVERMRKERAVVQRRHTALWQAVLASVTRQSSDLSLLIETFFIVPFALIIIPTAEVVGNSAAHRHEPRSHTGGRPVLVQARAET